MSAWVFQGLERSNRGDVTARLQTHPVTRHFRWLREGKALVGWSRAGGEGQRGGGTGALSMGSYAVESSSPWRVSFDSRQRSPAAGRGVSSPPSAQAGSTVVGCIQSTTLPPSPKGIFRR